MKIKKLIPAICLRDSETRSHFCADILKDAQRVEEGGADEILLWDGRKSFSGREEDLIRLLTEISGAVDTPLLVYQEYARFEDIKKIIYAGAAKTVMNPLEGGGIETLKEGVARFDTANVIGTFLTVPKEALPDDKEFREIVSGTGCRRWLFDADCRKKYADAVKALDLDMIVFEKQPEGSPAPGGDGTDLHEIIGDFVNTLSDSLADPYVSGAVWRALPGKSGNIYELKKALQSREIGVSLFESALPFSAFKLNGEGLIPVVVQDYKSGKVLMLAYMNEEAYGETIRSGRMTYYSRSRKCLWKKGETSGHYQFVKSLDIDCDADTILAKVRQIGAACHTGSESCFFTNLAKKEYAHVNPAAILQEIMATVADRKENPKEGSYTSYLFDKGIDKILKKVGEEATEIVIAAKNPDASELKYEISDFLYHMIVLMAERGVTWDEIFAELAKRH